MSSDSPQRFPPAVREAGPGLELVRAEATQRTPDPAKIAADQIAAAHALLARDGSRDPTWCCDGLRHLAGPLRPGDFVTIGSLPAGGKTTLVASQIDHLESQEVSTLCIPLEIDPSVARTMWAARRLRYDAKHVLRGEWQLLPEGAREAINCALDEQRENRFVHFAPPKRVTLNALVRWCRWGREQLDVRVVVLDHLHRMDFEADASGQRVAVTEAVRRLKDLARDLEVSFVAAAQLNRGPDPLDAYLPPGLSRLKESAGIAEESDVVLMLSRRLRPDISAEALKAFRNGHKSERDLAVPSVMTVTCRKHRLDDTARDRSILLAVRDGAVQDLPRFGEPIK